jgi:hypothetical protein
VIVERSTRSVAAASATVTSCRTNCNQISYFWVGVSILLRETFRAAFEPSCSVMT